MPMPRKVPTAFVLAVGMACAALTAVAQSVDADAECEVCTARHQSLQALQRARAERTCPDDAAAPCAPNIEDETPVTDLSTVEDDTLLYMPDGRPVGVEDK